MSSDHVEAFLNGGPSSSAHDLLTRFAASSDADTARAVLRIILRDEGAGLPAHGGSAAANGASAPPVMPTASGDVCSHAGASSEGGSSSLHQGGSGGGGQKEAGGKPLLVASCPGRAMALIPRPERFVDPAIAQRLLRLLEEGTAHQRWFLDNDEPSGPRTATSDARSGMIARAIFSSANAAPPSAATSSALAKSGSAPVGT